MSHTPFPHISGFNSFFSALDLANHSDAPSLELSVERESEIASEIASETSRVGTHLVDTHLVDTHLCLRALAHLPPGTPLTWSYGARFSDAERRVCAYLPPPP